MNSLRKTLSQWNFFSVGKIQIKIYVCAQLCLTFCDPMTVAHQGPLSMGFSRQEYWSGLLFPPPGDLLDPGIEPESLVSPALSGKFFYRCTTWEAQIKTYIDLKTEQKMFLRGKHQLDQLESLKMSMEGGKGDMVA